MLRFGRKWVRGVNNRSKY